MNKFEKISFGQWCIDTHKHFEPNCFADEVNAQTEYDAIKLPKRATTGSAGYDFFAPYDIEILPRQTALVPTGIRVILDDDKYLAIYPRSGLGFKYRTQLFNTCAVVDADYVSSDNEGHIWIKMFNGSPEGKTLQINAGDAFCQGIIQSYYLVDGDSREQGADRYGGFGSTG